MTSVCNNLMARRVLSDCRWALSLYTQCVSGEPLRVNWVSVITLLRAVGHVLDKVDAFRDADVKDVVEREWDQLRSTKPKPEIFWEFIESERNNVVKQYEFGFSRTVFVTPPPGKAGLIIPIDLLSVCGGPLPPQDLPNLTSALNGGPFEGRSELDVAREAVDWWDSYLTKIERLVDKQRVASV